MNQISNADSHALLTCFFQECESQFRFLEEKHGYLYLSGLAEYQHHYKIIRPYKDVENTPNPPFYAVTRYERNNQAIEVFYGDKNYAMEVYIYPDAVKRFSVQDILAASKKTQEIRRNMAHLTETKTIEQSLQWLGGMMKNYPNIFAPDDKLIQRAEVMREKILEQSIRSHMDTLVENASVRAAEAFVAKDYALVIDILSLYTDYLGRSDLKKLKIALEKIS